MKIIAFSNGDSNKTSTWSNVPYYFLKAAEKEGVQVVRVDITPYRNSALLQKAVWAYEHLHNKLNIGPSFERSSLHEREVRKIMMNAVKSNPDANLLLTFDFSHSVADKTDIKTLLLCDWDIEYLITQIDKRIPSEKERKLIEAQDEIIDSADYVVSIFPNAFEKMKSKHGNMHYFGTPINLDEPEFDIDAALDGRFRSRHLLFIGKEKYLSGAKELAKAVESFNLNHNEKFFVDIIGMSESITGIDSKYVKHYGYLKKDSEKQWKVYNSLLENAFFFVNTTDNWVGASSILDTAYLGIPCIINPNPDLTKTFGEDIYFGYYCKKNSAKEIEKLLCRISELSKEEYTLLSNNARIAVKGNTYGEYVKKILSLVTEADNA